MIGLLKDSTCLILYSGIQKYGNKNKATAIGFIYKEVGEGKDKKLKIVETSRSALSGVEHPGTYKVLSSQIPTEIPVKDINVFD